MPGGRPKNIKSPEKLWEYFLQYKKDCKENQGRKENFWNHKHDKEVSITRERPISWEGLECWLFNNGITSNLSNYKANTNNAYTEFSSILQAIDKQIFEDQYSGAVAGIYQQNIVARRLGLVDKKEEVGNPFAGLTNAKITIVNPKDDE